MIATILAFTFFFAFREKSLLKIFLLLFWFTFAYFSLFYDIIQF